MNFQELTDGITQVYGSLQETIKQLQERIKESESSRYVARVYAYPYDESAEDLLGVFSDYSKAMTACEEQEQKKNKHDQPVNWFWYSGVSDKGVPMWNAADVNGNAYVVYEIKIDQVLG